MTPTAAFRTSVWVAGALLVMALATGRAEAAALAAPFVVASAAMLTERRPPAVTVGLSADRMRVEEGDTVTVTVSVTSTRDVDAVTVRLPSPGVAPDGHDGVVVTAVRAGTTTAVSLTYAAPRWGRHRIGPGTAECRTAGFLRSVRVPVPAVDVEVLPRVPALTAQTARPRARVFAGVHRSRALGEGIEFAGIRPFTYGDRPRRVNWRATARTGELAVTTTQTDRSADVVLVIDALHDVAGARTSTLDTGVRAAAAVTAHYIGLGDSVALLEYGGHQRLLAPGSGRAQLARALTWLLATRSVVTAAVRPVQWPQSFGAKAPLVVVLTPLLDETSARLLVDLRRRGTAVVALDTLPADAVPTGPDPADDIARRLWLLERTMLVDRLLDLGVPVAAAPEPERLGTVLRGLVRVATAPRMALR